MANEIHPAPVEITEDEIKIDPILGYFHYQHLPPKLLEVSKPFCVMAVTIVRTLPRNA